MRKTFSAFFLIGVGFGFCSYLNSEHPEIIHEISYWIAYGALMVLFLILWAVFYFMHKVSRDGEEEV